MIRFDQFKLRTKLVMFFFLAVLIISLASLYMYLSLQALTHDATELFKSNLILTDVYRGLDNLQDDLDNYLTTSSTDDLLSFYDNLSRLSAFSTALEEKATQSRQSLGLSNTSHMIKNYLIEAEDTVIGKRGRSIQSYTTSYAQALKHHQSILRYIESIMSTSLIESTDRYNQIASQIRTSTYVNIALTLAVICLIIFLISGFSKEVTSPLSELASYSTRIAHGEYDLNLIGKKTNDEIGTLYDSFQYMVNSINIYVESLKDKVRLEKVLAEEQVHVLEMQSALREAELSALQAQVNPHFMFNTLNIGAKIAHLQNDPVTCEYLENTASIFRYNLKGLHNPATIKEEVENARAYLALLKTRFGDQLNFTIDIDPQDEALTYKIPRMTLQPLVENAYIHGISDLEEGGCIRIRLITTESEYHLTVEDTGSGFNPLFMEKLNDETSEGIQQNRYMHHGHTTGIGLNNLVQRLRLHTRKTKVIHVESTPGATLVTLILPKDNEEVTHV